MQTGSLLEESGWRQGLFVRPKDIPGLFEGTSFLYERDMHLVVASQSCDIANNNTESDPMLELSLCKEICIEQLDGNLTHNKNPRKLHSVVLKRASDEEDTIAEKRGIEFRAYEKIQLPKEKFLQLQPCNDYKFEELYLKSYIAWLSARYSRPALPTKFNNLLRDADPKGKLKGKAKKNNQNLLGVYVEITPDKEISEKENYSVNLLGLISSDFSGDIDKIKQAINDYAEVMRSAGMDVQEAVLKENEVSVAVIKRFKRFYYDDLSFKDSAPLPPETENNL